MRPLVQSLAAAGAAVLLVPGCFGTQAEPVPMTIVIGVDLPLTGDEGRAGQSTLNGIRYFVSQHPTLQGFTVVIDARDDAGTGSRDTTRGVKNLKAFIANPRVVGMLGPFDSSVARAQIPIANQAHLAMVSPATSSRCLTKEPYQPINLNPLRTAVSCKDAGLPSPGDLRPSGVNNYFRLSATDELQGPAAADYARKHLHLMRVAVISQHEAYGQLLTNSFTARFNKLGGTVVAREEVDPGVSSDLTAFLERAKKSGAQGIYFGGVASNNGCAVRHQMAAVFEAGAATPFIGGDGIAFDPGCVRDAGANAAGIYATVPAPDPEQIDSAQHLIKAFKTRYGRPGDFGPHTIAGYDAAGVLYDALDRAMREEGGTLPLRETVVKMLSLTTSFAGATGVFGFDKDGDTTLRLISVFRTAGVDPRSGWKWVDTINYTTALPY